MRYITFEEITGDGRAAYALYRAVTNAVAEGEREIRIERGVYDVCPEWCAERTLCISNHGFNARKRILLPIVGVDGLEIDFSGSTLLCHGILTPFAILDSKNITIRNLTLANTRSQMLEARIVAHGEDDSVELEPLSGLDEFICEQGRMFVRCVNGILLPVNGNVEFTPTGEIEPGTGDNTFGERQRNMFFSSLPSGNLLLRGVKRKPPIGNIAVFNASRRFGAGFFCEDSEKLSFENVTVNGCFGMGIIAQICRDISLKNFSTIRADERMHTANADATHFVDCSGVISVEDCTFEGQLDDALNIHGIYTRVVAKGERELFVREMHEDATGIRIYAPGDRIAVLDPAPLLPYAEFTVREVEYLNGEVVRLSLNESVDAVNIGDDVENISHEAELVFRRNTVRDNRARGMLIANRGHALIEDCYFRASGTAIKFESDGEYWFESGGTSNVEIKNCVFDRCKHGSWGRAVIECQPRRETIEGRYFHGKIAVNGCKFDMITPLVAQIDNVTRFVFKDNEVSAADGVATEITIHHVGECEIDAEVEIKQI